MLKKHKLTDDRWDEAVEELRKAYEPTDEELADAIEANRHAGMKEAWCICQENHEPTDDEVWELLADWNDAAYDDYCDSLVDQMRGERD